MHVLRTISVIICLVMSIMVLVSGTAIAQGGGKSLAELKTQAKKIKIGPADGSTEAEVIALMGQPAKVTEDVKALRGGRVLRERKILTYGPNAEIVIIILKKTGKVANIKYSD
jgi:hypothetical protein